MGICYAGLMCHAPIVIPEVAGDRIETCRASAAAMATIAQSFLRSSPNLILLISPHTPRPPSGFSVQATARISGDLGLFNFPQLRIDLPCAKTFQEKMMVSADQYGLQVEPIISELDHGAVVPLFFLQKSGWTGPVSIIGLPDETSDEDNRILGKMLQDLSEDSSIGIIASGDMSHRLQPGAPGGYHPDAKKFDEYVVNHISRGEYLQATQPRFELRKLAGEDVIDSLQIATAAINYNSNGSKVHSYEGPFGVGYLVASLYEESFTTP